MLKVFKRVGVMTMALTTVLALTVSASAASSMPDETSARKLTIYKYATVEDTVVDDSLAAENDAAIYEDEMNEEENISNTSSAAGIFQDVNTSEHQPMSNVVFDIYYYSELDTDVPASITVSDANSWVAENSDALATTLVTDENGCATWVASEGGNDADGVYLVVERSNRAVQISGGSNPFFISLPYTDPEGDGWLYDVVVQPKNELVGGPGIEKDVIEPDNDDASVNIGIPFSWIIRADVPADLYYSDSINDEVVEIFAGNYTITDEFDSCLDYVGNVKVVVVEDGKEISILEENSDYTIGGSVSVGQPGGTMILSLTNYGMMDVMDHVTNPENAELWVYVDSALNNSVAAGEEIYNDAILEYTNSTGYSYEAVSVSNVLGTDGEHLPEVHTGGFRIEKVDEEDASIKLAGAEFKIAASEQDARDKSWIKDANGEDIVLTTDSNGMSSFLGLAYDVESTDPVGGTYYWLVEVAAPEGYELNDSPMRITVNAYTYGEDMEPYQITNTPEIIEEIIVEDETTPTAIAKLPLTGNTATDIVLFAGIILIVGGAIAAIAATASSRKKRNI